MAYNELASEESIAKAAAALQANGMEVKVAATGAEAKDLVLGLLPPGAEVMNMTSITNDTIGLTKEIMESGKFNPVRAKLNDKTTPPREKKRLGAAPEWSTASVHAVTLDGKLMIASNTGSQQPAAAYGADHVIFVVGAQKIVPSLEEGFNRIYEYVLPLEAERSNKAYNITTGSFVSKLLIINREISKQRITVIIVKEVLGF